VFGKDRERSVKKEKRGLSQEDITTLIISSADEKNTIFADDNNAGL